VVVCVRLALAAGLLLPLAVATGSLRRLRRRWRRLGLIGAIGIALPFSLIAYGEQHITSSLTALLIAADPLFIVLLALHVDPSERASGTRLIGLLLGLVGVAVLLGLDVGGDALRILGGGMVLAAAMCYAVSALLVKRLADVPLLGSVSVTLGVAAVLLAPLALAHLPTHLPSPAVIASVLALSILCTALGYVIYYALIAEAGATRASLITYVNPAVAVLLGVVVLSEPLRPSTLLGFGLILLGCALSTGLLRAASQTSQDRRMPRPGPDLAGGRSS
jgi:drug/metabolite transporter (DMT)-like permease